MTVQKVIPANATALLDMPFRCCLGVSVGQPNFKGRRLKALLRWAADHADHCLIVVGDVLQRYNLIAERGCSENEATRAAEILGEDFLAEATPTLVALNQARFSIIRWRTILDHSAYPKLRRDVDVMIGANPTLRSLLAASASAYLSRRASAGVHFAECRECTQRLAESYLLEEIAAFAVLAADGFRIDLYPGRELPLLAALMTGKYPFVPAPLQNRINVELALVRQPSCHISDNTWPQSSH